MEDDGLVAGYAQAMVEAGFRSLIQVHKQGKVPREMDVAAAWLRGQVLKRWPIRR